MKRHCIPPKHRFSRWKKVTGVLDPWQRLVNHVERICKDCGAAEMKDNSSSKKQILGIIRINKGGS